MIKRSRIENNKELNNSSVLGLHYNPCRKKAIIDGGIGCFRAQPHNGSSLFCATTSGDINAGIPILINNKVANNIRGTISKHGAVEVELRGSISQIPNYFSKFRYPHVPKICLVVESILNVKQYISD